MLTTFYLREALKKMVFLGIIPKLVDTRGGTRPPSECDYYRKTRLYGDYQLIITINASTRQLTVQPNATSNIHIHTHTHTCRDLVNYLSGAGPITVLTEPHTLKSEIY